MSCDNCFDQKHWKCHDPCGCGYCYGEAKGRSAQKDMTPKRKATRSVLDLDRRMVRERYGFLTAFTEGQIQQIFEAKAAGVSMSQLAQDMGTTRDRIRTVYLSPRAPRRGSPPRKVRTSCPTCKRPYDKDIPATI